MGAVTLAEEVLAVIEQAQVFQLLLVQLIRLLWVLVEQVVLLLVEQT